MITIRSKYAEGETWDTLYRLCDPDDNAFAPGGISTITAAVYDLSGAAPTTNLLISASQTLLPSLVFFATLQTDYGWNADAVGYNFRTHVAPADLTGGTAVKGGHVALVEYKITTFQYGVRMINHYVTVTPQLSV